MYIIKVWENFRYIISKILKFVILMIMSMFLCKWGVQYVDNKYIVNWNFGMIVGVFIYVWIMVGILEMYMDCNVVFGIVFKLMLQMLVCMVELLLCVGYLGEMLFKENWLLMLEFVIDLQICWEFDRFGG